MASRFQPQSVKVNRILKKSGARAATDGVGGMPLPRPTLGNVVRRLADLVDMALTGVKNGDGLIYQDGVWVPGSPNVTGYPIVGSPTDGQTLIFDGSQQQWEPQDPEGGGASATIVGSRDVGWAVSSATATSPDVAGIVLAAGGTAAVGAIGTTNHFQSLKRNERNVTSASTSAIGYLRSSALDLWRGNAANLGGFKVVMQVGPTTGEATATKRFFAGVRGSIANPTDVNPSTLTDIIGIGYDAGDANLQIMHNDNSGAATKINTGIARTSTDRQQFFLLEISCDPNASSVNVKVTDRHSGTVFEQTITSDLPAAAQLLAFVAYASVGGTSSVRGIALFSYWQEAN